MEAALTPGEWKRLPDVAEAILSGKHHYEHEPLYFPSRLGIAAANLDALKHFTWDDVNLLEIEARDAEKMGMEERATSVTNLRDRLAALLPPYSGITLTNCFAYSDFTTGYTADG